MDSLTSKAAYLKGLCEGLKLDTEKAEGQLISKIIETLGDIAEAVDDVCDAHDELARARRVCRGAAGRRAAVSLP